MTSKSSERIPWPTSDEPFTLTIAFERNIGRPAEFVCEQIRITPSADGSITDEMVAEIEKTIHDRAEHMARAIKQCRTFWVAE